MTARVAWLVITWLGLLRMYGNLHQPVETYQQRSFRATEASSEQQVTSLTPSPESTHTTESQVGFGRIAQNQGRSLG